ncbi:AAA family ATPase [Salirhabdus salicampi]|uniref:AAA family ATPase n=1 Tax=Salirhabdus salicampi TaxID=476102 RepID=UPI0020C4655F|nr:AAA family ATPase [Salirhabdus salicampi]MCP8616134.1 AAA family ATPase [Salirhabdus salicampi]
MMNYFIISGGQSIGEQIKDKLKKDRKYARAFSSVEEFANTTPKEEQGILFVTNATNYDLYEISGDISIQYPLISVILIANEDEIDFRKAMYVGAVDIIDESLEDDEFKAALAKAESIIELKAEELEKGNIKHHVSHIVTVASTKGGIGKTTLSVNLSVSFALRGYKVIIIDLDLQFGDVPLLLDVQPKQTIYEWLKESYENGDGALDSYISKDAKTGVHLLAAPHLPEFAELINGEHISFILGQLKKEYDFIVVDTPPSFVETSLVAIENSDDIILVTSLDLPALKNGKLAVDTFQVLGLNDKVKVVLNRETPMEGMDRNTVENILGMKLTAAIPSDYNTVISGINLGNPFVVRSPKTAVAKSVMNLAEQLYPSESKQNNGQKKKKRKFSFLRSK